MPNSESRLDERIHRELRELEAPYNEGHWQEIEPFIDNLQPRSKFQLGSRTVLGIVLIILLIGGTYLALPFLKMRGDGQAEQTADTIMTDTGSTDPTFKPDTTSIVNVPPVSEKPVNTMVDSTTALVDTAKVEPVKPASPEKTDSKTDTTTVKKKKKRSKKKKDDTTTPPKEAEDDGGDLLKKDLPITAEPEPEPPKKEETPQEQPKE